MQNKFTKSEFKRLRARGYSHANLVTLFLAEAGCSKSHIAEIAGVVRATVTMTVSGDRRNDAVIEAITYVLGFNPWG